MGEVLAGECEDHISAAESTLPAGAIPVVVLPESFVYRRKNAPGLRNIPGVP